MVLLMIFSIFTVLAVLAVIWWCVFIYTNKWIATFIILVLVAISASMFVNWLIKPTPEEMSEHIRKTLSV